MALARIISRSPECWRELALDLLARRYAVEIISPDAIPDNFADLELRVEADPANDLTANIAARNGARSTSLDFVHHLRAPMEDFVRRPPPKVGVAAPSPGKLVNFNAKRNLAGEGELPGDISRPELTPASHAVSDVPEVKEGARLINQPEPVLPSPMQTTQRSKTRITIIFHRSRSKQKIQPKRSKRSGGWFLRTSAGFALVVTMGGMLVTGARHGDPLVQSVPADSQKVIPVENASSFATPELQRAIAATAENPTLGPSRRREGASVIAGSRVRQEKVNVHMAVGKVNDLTAPDATIYRDKPLAKTGSHVRHHKGHLRRDDTVAEDTVTYLDRKSAPGKRLR